MGTAAQNKQHVLDAEEHMARGDREGWLALLADDVRWTVMGRTSWSRTYAGKTAVRAELVRPLVAQYAEPYRRTTLQLVAEDDWVVARCRGHVVTKAGELYDNEYCFLYRLADGLIQEIIEYGDTALIERVLEPHA
ncbi:MAG TPA: nuclear transport factor 2 family protein [Pseudonocardia sp.]|nr:nuclear transport factor 2 family protein [Pseudonocardia sp.]